MTLFSVLTILPQGETTPQEGTVYKHPALRVGYVSQHATHHIGNNFGSFSVDLRAKMMDRASLGKDSHRLHSMAIPRRP